MNTYTTYEMLGKLSNFILDRNYKLLHQIWFYLHYDETQTAQVKNVIINEVVPSTFRKPELNSVSCGKMYLGSYVLCRKYPRTSYIFFRNIFQLGQVPTKDVTNKIKNQILLTLCTQVTYKRRFIISSEL